MDSKFPHGQINFSFSIKCIQDAHDCNNRRKVDDRFPCIMVNGLTGFFFLYSQLCFLLTTKFIKRSLDCRNSREYKKGVDRTKDDALNKIKYGRCPFKATPLTLLEILHLVNIFMAKLVLVLM